MPSTTLNTYQKLHKQFSVTSSLISPYCTYIVEASLILRMKNSFSCFEIIIRLLGSVNVSFLILEFPYYFFQYFLPRSLRVFFLFFLQNVPVPCYPLRFLRVSFLFFFLQKVSFLFFFYKKFPFYFFYNMFPSYFFSKRFRSYFFYKKFLSYFFYKKFPSYFFLQKVSLLFFFYKKFSSYFFFTICFLPIFFPKGFLPIFFYKKLPSYFCYKKFSFLFFQFFLPHFFSVSFLFFRVSFFNIDVSFQILIRGKQYLKTFVALKCLAL